MAAYNSIVGIVGGSQSMNNGILLMRLAEHDKRPGIEAVAQKLRKDLNTSPSMRVFVRVPPTHSIAAAPPRPCINTRCLGRIWFAF